MGEPVPGVVRYLVDEYQQAARTLCDSKLPCNVINVFMLKMAVAASLSIWLIFNKLRYVPFLLQKQVVSACQTVCFALPNGLFGRVERHVLKSGPHSAVFSCIFVSMAGAWMTVF